MLNTFQTELLEHLQKNKTVTLADFIHVTQKPKSTVHENLSKLIDRKLVTKHNTDRHIRGRPTVYFTLAKEKLING